MCDFSEIKQVTWCLYISIQQLVSEPKVQSNPRISSSTRYQEEIEKPTSNRRRKETYRHRRRQPVYWNHRLWLPKSSRHRLKKNLEAVTFSLILTGATIGEEKRKKQAAIENTLEEGCVVWKEPPGKEVKKNVWPKRKKKPFDQKEKRLLIVLKKNAGFLIKKSSLKKIY